MFTFVTFVVLYLEHAKIEKNPRANILLSNNNSFSAEHSWMSTQLLPRAQLFLSDKQRAERGRFIFMLSVIPKKFSSVLIKIMSNRTVFVLVSFFFVFFLAALPHPLAGHVNVNTIIKSQNIC